MGVTKQAAQKRFVPKEPRPRPEPGLQPVHPAGPQRRRRRAERGPRRGQRRDPARRTWCSGCSPSRTALAAQALAAPGLDAGAPARRRPPRPAAGRGRAARADPVRRAGQEGAGADLPRGAAAGPQLRRHRARPARAARARGRVGRAQRARGREAGRRGGGRRDPRRRLGARSDRPHRAQGGELALPSAGSSPRARRRPPAPTRSRARTCSTVTPGCSAVSTSSLDSGSGSSTPRSVITRTGPAPCSPSRARSVGPVPCRRW